MADILPPAPIDEPPKSYQWVDWYIKLRKLVNSVSNVPWSNINTSGSNLTDISTRNHNDLQTIQGGGVGDYQHLTTTEKNHIGKLTLYSLSSDPTTTDIPTGTAALYANTTSGVVSLWVNDSGTMKKVTLT